MKAVCVLTTAPDLSAARRLAAGLLSQNLAACVSLIPALESHYVWKKKRTRAKEVQLIIKTSADLFKKIELFFKENHPYDVPELIALPVLRGSQDYLGWIQKSVRT